MSINIQRLRCDTAEFETAARWRHDAFFEEDGISYAESRAQLHQLAGHQDYEVALLAELFGVPAGLCLFVRHELEPKHDLTPWLASLIVAPEFRKQSVGRALVHAIEAHAASVGCTELYLYTVGAEPFYARLGWEARDRFESKGEQFVLMARTL
jgi:predicted N-acetyltransferase YhbS